MTTKSSDIDQAKTLYRVYDTVEIIAPHVFTRCGYPIDVSELKDEFVTSRKSDIVDFIRAFEPSFPATIDSTYWGFQRVAKALAVAVAAQRGFGGSERAIHTKERPDIVGQICTVTAKHVVMTGRRYSGGWSGGYYDPPEYDPPSLGNRQAHVILSVDARYALSPGAYVRGFEIEARHVRPSRECPTYAGHITSSRPQASK